MSHDTPPPDQTSGRFCPWRDVLIFALLSLAGMAVVFGSALWNASLLAPLDIPAALYSKYHWLDESQGPVPANHYIVDIFDHELPRQYTIHRAIQSGEFPWWDPYTDAGRPLAADAHISGTDVLRLLLYHLLPFVPAYNLTKLAHSFLLGLGTFLLLRFLGHRLWLAAGLALSLQFAGPFALFQTPLCVPAAATWYPWLWLAWACHLRKPGVGWVALSGLFCALSIAAGNQQTFAYLALFAVCFLIGILWHDRKPWRAAIAATVLGPFLGVLLAAPFLVPQIELYLLCERHVGLAGYPPTKLLAGLASLTGFFPWALGTFRTIDASKVFGETALGFALFIGCAGAVLAALGALTNLSRTKRTAPGSVALLLVAAYFVICSTPLLTIFYTRSSVLAVLGLIILAAEGARILLSDTVTRGQRRVVLMLVTGVVGALLVCNIFAFAIYPRLQSRVEAFLLEREQRNPSLDSAPDLRRFQVANLPREISVLNCETVFGAGSVLLLLAALRARNPRRRSAWLGAALTLALLSELSFTHRFTVKAPVARWSALLAGGPEQRQVVTALNGGLRLREETPGRFDRLFPGALAHLYQLHVAHGYSSFPLVDISAPPAATMASAPWYDGTYVSDMRGQPTGRLELSAPRPTPSRFRWQDNADRVVRITGEKLNHVTVEVAPGPPGTLWRTDRFYPGWKLVSPNLKTQVVEKNFLTVNIPADRVTLEFEYRPRFLTPSLAASAFALLICLGGLVAMIRSRRGRT